MNPPNKYSSIKTLYFTKYFGTNHILILAFAFAIVALPACDNLKNLKQAKNKVVTEATIKSSEQVIANGYRTDARFNRPVGIAIDKVGNLFISDQNNHVIRKITPDGKVINFAGQVMLINSYYFGSSFGHETEKNIITINNNLKLDEDAINGAGLNAILLEPHEMVVDANSNLYLVDGPLKSVIRKISPNGEVTTYTGKPSIQAYINGKREDARFGFIEGIAFDHQDNLFLVDSGNNAIRKVSPNGMVSTYAGNIPNANHSIQVGGAAVKDGVGIDARFNYPSAIAVDRDNNIYVGDSNGTVIRKIATSAEVSTLAGTPYVDYPETEKDKRYYYKDGLGAVARFGRELMALACDSFGNIYVADTNNSSIRKITPKGEVSTFAGSPFYLGNKEGSGKDARFYGPSAIVIDSQDNLYVTDQGDSTIRKITPQTMVTHFAGKFIEIDSKRSDRN